MRKILISLLKTFGIVLAILSFSVSYAFADVDINDIEGVLNGVVSPKAVNEYNKPFLADRNNIQEMVDPVTGALSLRQLDVNLPGKDGFDLSIARIYNSSQAEVGKRGAKVTSTSSSWTEDVSGWFIKVEAYKVETQKYFTIISGPFNNEKDADDSFNFYYYYEKNDYWYVPTKYYESKVVYHKNYHINNKNTIDSIDYLRSRYDLGCGWAFSFPSLQIEENSARRDMYFHDGTGACFRIVVTPDTSDSNLENYEGKDVLFDTDNGTYSNGQMKSAYKFVASDKKTTYFGNDGRLLGIKDRFGNEIKFTHQMRTIVNKEFPVISNIYDTVGRTINFNYESNVGLNNTEKLTVTVTEPFDGKNLSLVYTKKYVEVEKSEDGVRTEKYYQPCLTRYKNAVGKDTVYGYNIENLNFSFFTKDLSEPSITGFLTLDSVNYPTSYTKYGYEKTKRNLGPDGATEAIRYNSRYDADIKFNFDTKSMYFDGKYNQVSYIYSGDCSGYPDYKDDTLMPEAYEFGSTENLSNGMQTKRVYNGKKNKLYEEYTASNKEKKKQTILEYHSVFKSKPTKIETAEYASDSTLVKKLYTLCDYYDWGGLKYTTLPMTEAQLADEVLKDKYTSKYEYEPNYKLMSNREWYQNLNDKTRLSETFQYDSKGRITSFTNANKESINYEYTSDGKNVTKVTVTKTLEDGKIAKTEKEYGSETNYAFPKKVTEYYTDNDGTLKSSSSEMTYNMLLGVFSTVTEANQTTTLEYDNVGRLISVSLPSYTNVAISVPEYGINSGNDAYETKQYYDYTDGAIFTDYKDATNQGLATTMVKSGILFKKKGDTKQYRYSHNVTNYDGFGNLREEGASDADGNYYAKKMIRYDNMLRPNYLEDAEGNENTYLYGPWGDLNETTDSFGNLFRNDIDIKLKKEINYFVDKKNVEQFRQDSSNKNLMENIMESDLDDYGRVCKRSVYPNWPNKTEAIAENYTYDILGNLETYLDPKQNKNGDGYTRKYIYDAMGRVKEVKDALDQITEVEYSALGNVKNISIKKNETSKPVVLYTKEYDELSRITQREDPLLNTQNYEYNAAEQLEKYTDRKGSTFDYTYNEHNNVTIQNGIPSEGTSCQYKYHYTNPNGVANIFEFKNGTFSGLTGYKYDREGRISKNSNQCVDKNYFSFLENSYDKSGKLLSNWIYNDESAKYYTNYLYNKTRLQYVQMDGKQQPDTTGNNATEYQYLPNGKVQYVKYPKLNDGSELSTEYIYDKINRLDKVINWKGTQVLSQYSYGYDANGNITSIDDGTGAVTYTYDKLDRLEQIIKPGVDTTIYGYDLKGNRETISGTIPELKAQDVSYTWDVWNRLESVSAGDATINMSYRQDGLRSVKKTPTNTVQYHYDGDGNVIAESENGQNISATYVWGSDRVLSKKDIKTGKEYYYLYNGHGDVVQMVDKDGKIVNNYKYDEWGNTLVANEGVKNPFKYSGEIYDDETGLYYLRARYYDPEVGRFISEDSYEGTIANPLSLNLYTYCYNDPISYIDPSGHMGIGQFFKKFLPGMAVGFTGFDDLKNLFSVDTFWGMVQFGEAVINGDVSIKHIASSVGASMVEPFKYLFDHSKEVWTGKPSDAAVYEYGKHMGNVIQMVVGTVGGGGVLGAKLMGTLGKVAPKLCKIVDKVASQESILRKLPFCFTGDTLVYTDAGHKEIKDIKVGDQVYAKNPETGEKSLKKVTQVYINETDTLVHVSVGETVINATPNHPFYVEGKGWILAGALEGGDKLHLYSGEEALVKKVTWEVLKKKILVYNLEVEDFHTYYVSDQNVLVHNGCGPDIKITSKAKRAIKKLSPEAKKGFDEAFDALKTGDFRGLHNHPLNGNRKGQWALDVNGTGGGRGGGRVIYEKLNDGNFEIVEIIKGHNY